LAAPTVLGGIDTYGIELIHPMREGRSPQQIGRKGVSNHRWMVGGKLCLLLNQWGLVVAWACATTNVADNTFQWLIRPFEEHMIVLSDPGFHAAEGDPSNLKLCQRGEWQDRMLVETVLSMLTLVSHLKKVMHRGWAYFQARLAFTMAAFNVLVQWVVYLHPAANYHRLTRPTFTGAKRSRREGSHGLPAALSSLVTPSKPAMRTHVACSGHLPWLLPTTCAHRPAGCGQGGT